MHIISYFRLLNIHTVATVHFKALEQTCTHTLRMIRFFFNIVSNVFFNQSRPLKPERLTTSNSFMAIGRTQLEDATPTQQFNFVNFSNKNISHTLFIWHVSLRQDFAFLKAKWTDLRLIYVGLSLTGLAAKPVTGIGFSQKPRTVHNLALGR